MGRRLIEPSTTLPVSLALAKSNLRLEQDETHMDDLVTMWVKGVAADLEHQIGQCLMAQIWEVTQDAFAPEIELPHPVISITSVKYVDADGVERVLDAESYRLSQERYRTALMPARGVQWPTGTDVAILAKCGFDDSASVPDNIRLYILAKLVEQFDPITRLERDTVQSVYVDRLLDACRAYS